MALGDAGADVAVTSRNGDDAEPVAVALRAKGRRALGLLLEVRNKASIRVCFERIDREWGSVDILVNNAGTNIPQELDTLDEDSWDVVMDRSEGSRLCDAGSGSRMVAADAAPDREHRVDLRRGGTSRADRVQRGQGAWSI